MVIFWIIVIAVILIVANNSFLRNLENAFNLPMWRFVEKHPLIFSIYSLHPISTETQQALMSRFPFYRDFPIEIKRFYNYRLAKLINSFEFKTDALNVDFSYTDKAIVLAHANRMTLGFKDYLYRSCTVLELHESAYFSEQLQQWHRGDAGLDGTIRLSLKHLEEGDNNTHDGINLAIHEFAHAIMIELFTGDERLGFYERFMDYKHQSIKDVDEIIEKKLLREYAYTNDPEFFSVTTEVFFETPEVLKNNVPDFYNVMCRLYNQQPHLVNPLTQTI
jgi:MtfA peptidase